MWLRLRFIGISKMPCSINRLPVADIEIGVVAQQIGVVLHRAVHEIEGVDRAEPGHRPDQIEPVENLLQARAHAVAQLGDALIDVFLLQDVDGRDRGGHRSGMPVVGAGEEDIAARIGVEPVHQIGAPASAAIGKPFAIALPMVVRSGVTPQID